MSSVPMPTFENSCILAMTRHADLLNDYLSIAADDYSLPVTIHASLPMGMCPSADDYWAFVFIRCR
jgi:hypothetical protein